MDDVYRRLAARLDALPHGFPRTPGGVELRILQKIFSPEDAALAARLMPMPETVEELARRLHLQAEELRPRLESMTTRGQILCARRQGQPVYMLAPFVVGIYELQLGRMDAELAGLFEEYAPALVRELGGSRPALARVVPVNARIEAQADVLRYESVRELLARARSFRLMECICRKEQALLGQKCSHTLETCLAFSPAEDAHAGTLPEGFGRSISHAEALAVLDRAEQEGLVHCTYNVQRQHMFVCNCCSCCCGFLRGLKQFGAPHLLLRSNFVAAVDRQACSACGACLERCPMEALRLDEAGCQVDGQRCLGCGVCNLDCPTDALSLVARPPGERDSPPGTLASWALQRALHRSGPLRTAAQVGGMAVAALRGKVTG